MRGYTDHPQVEQLGREALGAFNKLSSTIDSSIEGRQHFPNNQIKVVLYFDEAQTLSDEMAPKNIENKSLYDVLCSAFDHLRSASLFIIFLSTNSRLDKLVPGGPLARSARARENWHALQAPITETPFDCSPDFPIIPGTMKLEETCDVAFMARFGRPL